jgi:hypothetical protein
VSPALGALLAAIPNARRLGSGWRADCPCCTGSGHLTVSVREGQRVPVVAICFRCGAHYPEIRAALGIAAEPTERRPPVRVEPEHTPNMRTALLLLAAEERRRPRYIEERTQFRESAAVHDHRDAAIRWRGLAGRLALRLGEDADSVWDLLELAVAEDREADLAEAALDAARAATRKRPTT